MGSENAYSYCKCNVFLNSRRLFKIIILLFCSYRVEEVVPAVYTESDISTETASSPITDLSQSSLQDEFKTETNLKEEESSQEDSQNEEVSKELDTKFEIPKVKSETAMPRLVICLYFSSCLVRFGIIKNQ